MTADPLQLLTVRVRPCTINKGRFRWHVMQGDGSYVQHAPDTYATEEEARRAGEEARRELSDRRPVGKT